MVTPFDLLCLPVGIIESMAGILGDGIILATIASSCIGSKTWPPYDMIVISLSTTRFILQLWTTLDFLISIFYEPLFYKENVFVLSKTIFTFLSYSSLCFGAWLSVFYCIKVASFTQSFFIWLKLRIARLVPWMLLTSWLGSFAAAIPFAWDIYSVHENITAPSSMTNSSSRRTTRKDSLGLIILLSNAGIVMPLILSVVSSVLLIRSLWIHTRRMQSNASGFRDPSLEAHRKAIKSVFSFLILYIIYFICVLIVVFNGFSPLSNGDSICVVIMAACLTAHTLVLIWSNPKFQELPARMWHHSNCYVGNAPM
ncbi:taste receptor type 2 member 40-like [Onychostruthus taczanowskii]|uniref:taste receptor type 2 member 40-like n=1 Tax=Onychostruthus taczanowskii TaxID=356909 RepID=UPI001B80139C|nr:taste receptor type 2 member 40-like [Onychostruthus taczanowskii]